MNNDQYWRESRRWVLRSGIGTGAGIALCGGSGGSSASEPEIGQPLARPPKQVLAKIGIAVERSLGTIMRDGNDNVFPTPAEITWMRDDRQLQHEVALAVISSVADGGNMASSMCIMEVPKGAAESYRQCTFLDPLLATQYLAYALLAGEQLESQRPLDKVHSYRLTPDGAALFDTTRNASEAPIPTWHGSSQCVHRRFLQHGFRYAAYGKVAQPRDCHLESGTNREATAPLE